jgi:aerobic C4-dicarboxylate transport protein
MIAPSQPPPASASPSASPSKPWYRHLYAQTILGVLVGIAVGFLFPAFAKNLKPLGEAFVALIKMMIGPIIFCTIVHGIASIGDLRKLGRLGIKSLFYFEVVSTLALLIGLAVVNLLQPGVGFTPAGESFHAPADSASSSLTDSTLAASRELSAVDFLRHLIPETLFSPFVEGEILQVLFVSLLAAVAILGLGERRSVPLVVIDSLSQIFFGMLQLLVKLAPVGAFGAMAYTVASYGGEALSKLLFLMLGFYLTAALFVGGVLGGICWWNGFSLWRFLWYLREELLLVLSTSSSETALPSLMTKLEELGCAKSTVGLVVPTGYSFNLDGTNIYMSMAAIFLAQATNTPLSWSEQLWLLAVAMLTSKGASGVTGAGFITLAATIQVIPSIPAEAFMILLGIDRFMSECRAITNFIGNSVAAVVISRWEKELTDAELARLTPSAADA